LAGALREALRRLPQRERAVLRLHVFQHLSTEQLGRIFHVNPATARRWIQGARETVLDFVRQRLASANGLSSAEIDSLVRGVHSGIELSLTALHSVER
jgi:RNA polymerase sigma-70 factor (ECF subfamily)